MRWPSSRNSGKTAMMRPASEMSRVSTVTPACRGVRLDDGQERVRRQGRGLVSVRVNDGRVSHRVLRSTSATLLDIKISQRSVRESLGMCSGVGATDCADLVV